ncbi:hypothetical protein EMIT0111MI5_90049 [Burkholderia sp. IT-111MI5]
MTSRPHTKPRATKAMRFISLPKIKFPWIPLDQISDSRFGHETMTLDLALFVCQGETAKMKQKTE